MVQLFERQEYRLGLVGIRFQKFVKKIAFVFGKSLYLSCILINDYLNNNNKQKIRKKRDQKI